ncbi:MAG: type VII secretion target [Mycobacterium sp.]
MGEQQSARVDTAAVRAVADRFDAAADQLDRVARTPLGFGGLTAGRAHAVAGEELRLQMQRASDDLAAWARAAAEIAAGLRAGAGHYLDADRDAAVRIN